MFLVEETLKQSMKYLEKQKDSLINNYIRPLV